MLKITMMFVLLICPVLRADERFAAGNAAYDAGSFAEAVDQYEALLQTGDRTSDVYFNLGNAYYRVGKKGHAMAAFLAARQLAPRDPDVSANLAFVQESIADKLDVQSPTSLLTLLGFWVKRTSLRELAYAAVIVWAIGFLLLLLVLLMPATPWSSGCRALGVGVVVVSCVLGAAASINALAHDTWGAVTAPVTTAMSGPGRHNTVVFELHEGAPFIIERVENDWLQVELSDGKKGWLEKKDVRAFLIPEA